MQQDGIAAIGIACRFPGAKGHREFWKNLDEGRSTIGEVPRDRSVLSGHGAPGSAWAGLIDDVDSFDAPFFRLSPLEAESTDPQQRIMLELAWSCIEDAGVPAGALTGRDVGVFLGSFNLDYKELQERRLREVAAHHSTGTIGAVIANRVSHFFDLRGPSVVVDTASSASLHALHLAVQSLQQGECDLALAGGVNLALTSARYTSFSKTGMLSPTGACRPFDESADGYVRGEGAGLVLLKPLADAVRDGDPVYGVIRGTAANHSGRTRTLTHPSDVAQAEAITNAFLRAGISPDTVGYVEAHGTGTPTGDPAEFQGLLAGFRQARSGSEPPGRYNYCGLGSVKPNIGHLEAAAGIAGVLKVLLAMEHKRLPKLLNFQKLNPRIELEGTPFHIVDSSRDWEPLLSESGEPLPRRAGVSSFGIGGTNAHAVLEEGPRVVPEAVPRTRPSYLVCLSARTPTAMERRIRDLGEWLDTDGAAADLMDLSATLLLGREHLGLRTALVVRDRDDLRAKLDRLLDTGLADDCFRATAADSEAAAEHRTGTGDAFRLDAHLPEPEYRQRLLDLAEDFAGGGTHPWEDLFTGVGARRLRLPTYAFDRRRFWITPDAAGETPTGPPNGREPLRAENELPVPETTVHRRREEWAGLGIQESVEADLRILAAGVLKLGASEVHPGERLSDLGFDSVGNTLLALRLSEHFGVDVTPSLFYTYFTLDMLRDHFLREHADAVARTYAVTGTARSTAAAERGEPTASRSPAPATDDAIAVIGMSGRFPQARTVDEFWQLLADGRDAVGPIPADRLRNWRTDRDASGVRGGWLPGAAEFDPLFFEISPREAEAMDPRQRLLLQESWRALEDAGYGSKQLRDNTMGMFVGAEQGDYQRLLGDEETLTSSHDGILASRLGYLLNFSGPVLSINTACSAGLAAVHQACLSLRAGECDTAVAAGVNLLAGGQFHEHASQAGMLSPDGVCHAFDKRANGMVMAEAVAAVVLKPLSRALADRDRVHAVIRASGVNYDGRTNGITAPSQTSQAALLDSVYQRFGVDPADIEHVVAHGTGTRLGDPIEVNALAEVFGRYTDKTQYCALTSVKTNVGHTLAASGVVSLIALVQSLRHRSVPASLHCEQESEYIDWSRSPFYVNTETRPWAGEPGRTRLGAVSSFGISGTNAHVVVESHDPPPETGPDAARPCHLLALSGKTDEALRQRAADLLAFLRSEAAGGVGLDRISSTLLAGRHHFAHRRALVAATPEEAERLLQGILDGEDSPRAFHGVSGRGFRAQPALADYGNELIGRVAGTTGDTDRYQDQVRALADLYCQGYELDWEKMFGDRPLPCVSLPGYPYARETYWADAARPVPSPLPGSGPARRTAPHPLLDSNDSTLQAQRFTKHLSTDEFFLRDHVVDGKILLPGVAHMEMAYAASRLSTGADTVVLRDIIWGHPVVMADDTRTVGIELSPLPGDALEYTVYDEVDGERTVFSQGRASYADGPPTRERSGIDVAAIKERCSVRRENAEIFADFRELGFGYGETFQAIETLYCGETEALARITLGEGLDEEFSRFTLHPSLFDAALNTLRGIGEQDGVLRIPFSLEELVVFAPIPRLSYCHATIHRIARDGGVSVNLAICDDGGTECVRLTGLVFKEFVSQKDDELHLYVPRWKDSEARAPEAPPGPGLTLLVLSDDDAYPQRFRAVHPGSVVRVRSGGGFRELEADLFAVDRRSPEDFDRLLRTLRERSRTPHAIVDLWPLTAEGADLTLGLESLLHLFRAVHRTGAEQETRYLSVFADEPGPDRVAAEALSGFGRAMTPVDHLFRTDSLQVDAARDVRAVVESVLGELGEAEGAVARDGHEIRRTGGVRAERVLRPWTGGARRAESRLPLKEGGVYVVSGGAGVLGLRLGEFLARQCRARLVLLGRRQPDAGLREKTTALEALGAEVLYLACDVADREGLDAALTVARERFGRLDGVFHSAGVIGGTAVTDVDRAGFEAVLSPKLHGTVHLDELTADDPLDFFVLFSSIAAYVGDFGQGAYAAANRFLDGYAHQREALRSEGSRHGRSVSINWPYWDEGGMLGELAEDGAAKTLYHDYSGLRGLGTEEGIRALLRILASDETQVVVTKGERRRIERVLRVAGAGRLRGPVERGTAAPSDPAAVVSAAAPSTVAAGELTTRTVDYLKDRLSQVFRIPKGRIDSAAELGEYGIESIQIMELTRLLGKDFESIPGTLFFEYRTVDELAGYFTENQAGRLAELLGLEPSAAEGSASVPQRGPADPPPTAPRGRDTRTVAPRPTTAPGPLPADRGPHGGRSRDVAIIGLSGRYPKARSLDEFWGVLERGEDCVEEIPPHRWDKDAYYAAEKTPGKTNSKWGGFIDGAENFDALFFNMSPNQAALTDPQSRLFLQSAWEAMEDAGYTRRTLAPGKTRNIGVYLGMMWNEYQLYSGQDVVLSDRAAASNAVSYFFNLHGQSLTVDTACSSSLYAIAMAVESIRSGASSLAFAGGANLSLHPNKYVSLSQMNFFAEDGRCRSFGAGGTGYVPGEGVGCVLLKPLDQAVADGDHIHGVIRGVATLHGGKTNGMTVPNPLAQADMVAAALDDAGLSAEDINYVEGHGTGTSLGDPIEITGLTRAFRKHTDEKQYCPIGSVKSNIGHLEGAAGIAAVTKVLLQMRHRRLVPSLHSDRLNPHIDFPSSPFYVQREAEPWEPPTRTVDGVPRTMPRTAGVSSFGAHGAIAHVIIEEHLSDQERTPRQAPSESPQLVVLSAKDGERLREKAEALLTWLSEAGRDTDLADVAYTLQIGREAMEERIALVVSGKEALREKLRVFLDGQQGQDAVFRDGVRQNKDYVALLEGDEEMREVVRTWLEQARYEKLAEVWVKGVDLDWDSLVRGTRPRRVPLPTYPFAQERHWLDPSPAPAPPTSGSRSSSAPETASRASVPAAEEQSRTLAFVEDWEPAALDPAASREIGAVVFLCTGSERQAEVARALRVIDPGVRAIFVGYGQAYRKLAPDSYQIRRGQPQDYRDAFQDIAEGRAGVDAIVSLEALEAGAVSDDFGDVVLTLRAVAETELGARCLVIAGQYRDDIERALLEAHIGFERSLGLVMPKLSVAAVLQDRSDPLRPADTAGWLERLFGELRQDRTVSALYRQGRRFVSRVRETALTEGGPDGLRHGGTYLITGGCGGLGMIVARHLAENFGANLVLTGRSPLDEARREALHGLGAGSRVLYVRADAADADDMRRVVARARERFGPLHGVVHAAGVQGRGSVLRKDLRDFDGVLAPKVRGTLVLDEALRGEELDFVCYFSSISAVVGDFGTCDYAVGNRFQMAYAEHRDAQVRAGRLSGRTVVVNWPLWREGGMGFDHDTTTMMLRSSGQEPLETGEGVALFERLLSQEATRHVILVGEPGRVHRSLGLAGPSGAPLAAAPPSAAPPEAAPLPAPGHLTEERLERDLREIVGRTLNLDPDRFYEDDNLADYGFDSVTLTELADGLGRHYGIEVTPSIFYSHSTLRKLGEYFAAEHGDLLAAFYGHSGTGASDPEPVRAEPVPEPPRSREAPADRSTPVGDDDAIAVIGMSGRFPGADNVSELWSVLADGRDVVGPVTRERLSLWGEPHDSPLAAFRMGQLADPDEFDPLFFEISPKEARSLDPRQRLLLQESWRALEDAGWTPEQSRRIGVFVGVEQGDYDDAAPEEGSVTANHDGVLAARLSYFLDLKGPAMAVNTACSSGLVAAHQACASIRNGECDSALAAGVSLVTTPRLVTRTREAGMLSEDGLTYAFDRRANGMVLSEAVAVVVLKRLSAAVADGDTVHGVIRASGVNYDGRSNGLTAPSGEAQADLLRATYQRYGVDPADIDYVVAHGTGTRLGDPVEVNALNEVFRGFTDKRRYCALTSIKPNVGHTLAASGLVSLLGVLQAMRHETIPASLHCEQENEYIDWNDSPFFVNRVNRAWPESAGRRRTAALSSFGMSGTNAHMVVESAPAREDGGSAARPAHVLALSAKSEESLRRRVADLIDVLEDAARLHGLSGVSGTLLERRTHFRHRCAVVAGDAAEAVRLLRQWAAGEQGPDVFHGVVPKGFARRPEVRRAGDRLLEEAPGLDFDGTAFREALRAAAKVYCQGYDLAWRRLTGGRHTAPVALPGYPFARKRLWRSRTAPPSADGAPRPGGADAAGTRFTTTFTGEEPFLRDHVVAGERVLPGVVHLELARGAHDASRAERNGRAVGVAIRDVVWLRPVKGGHGPLDVVVELEPAGAEGSRYRVLAPCADGGRAVHSQGRVETLGAPSGARLDLAELRAQCGLYEISGEEVRLAYRRQGIDYGPSFQGLVRLFVGEAQVLAEIRSPEGAERGPEGRVLDPALLDAALQASLGLRGAGEGLRLPYAAEKVEILGPCEPVMWARVRRSGPSAAQGVEKFDVDLCDAGGVVRVRVSAFSTRPLGTAAAPVAPERSDEDGDLTLLEPVWEVAPPQPDPPAGRERPEGRTLLVGEDPEVLASVLTGRGDVDVLLLRADDTVDGLRARLSRGGPYGAVVWLARGGAPVAPESQDLITRQEEGVYAGFRLAKALLALGYERHALEWTALTVRSQFVLDSDRVDPSHAGVHGLLGSLVKENPRWRMRLADVEELRDGVLEEAFGLPAERSGGTWAHRGGRWYRQTLRPVEAAAAHEDTAPYRRGGVYVVIGGAGGIGGAWTEHVIRDYGAQVVWIGRRAEDEDIRARIDELARMGPAPWYLRADATDREALADAVARIRARFPEIHGVVHAALVLLDQSVAGMAEDRFREAVRAKVDTSVRMAQVFADEPLDFVMFHSSLNSFQRSAGQSNYVCGCVFKDAFAQLWRQSRPGLVKVVNWGYWGSAGAVASEAYRRRMARNGIGSIEPAEGMAALDLLLSGPYDQLALEKTASPRRRGTEARTTASGDAHDQRMRRIVADSGSARGFDDDLLCELLLAQLRTLGMSGEGGSVADLRAVLRPGGGYDRWLEESLRVLAEHGYLEYGPDRYTLTGKATDDRAAVWQRWEAVCRESGGSNAYVNLLDPAIRALPDVLTGRRPATDVVFPGSSTALVRGLYRDCDSAEALNEVVADMVAARVESLLERDPGHRVRILEIGSGTGGTSEKALGRLAPYLASVAEYCYTDVSGYFLRSGRQEFGADHPYLRFELFDVELDPAGQGLGEGAYDIVLATNVLHATRDLRAAVRNTRALLAAEGELILNELAARTPFLHLTFGLLDGWWLYQDADLRIQGCPGLAPDTWRRVLEEEGFDDVSFPASAVHHVGHQIVGARVAGYSGAAASASAPQDGGNLRERVGEVIVSRLQVSLGLDRGEISEEDAFADYGVDSILGVELVERLNEDLGGVLVTTDLFDHGSVRRLTAYVADTLLEQGRALPGAPAATAPSAPEPEPAADAVARAVTGGGATVESVLSEVIVSRLQVSLGLDRGEISEEDAFADYGVDSILGVELVERLNEDLGGVLVTTDLFDHGSVRALARYVARHHPDVRPPAPDAARTAVPDPEAAPARDSAPAPPVTTRPDVPAATGSPVPEPIAIIGMSGKFGTAKDPDELWRHLSEGRSLVGEISRWDLAAQAAPGASYPRYASLMDDIDRFDPAFFQISGLEATYMDPQQRMVLEESWKALEDAGYAGEAVRGRSCGLYVGTQVSDYLTAPGEDAPAQAMWGNAEAVIPARVSYFLDLRGPAIAVETACSGSLVALQLACQALRTGEVAMALAGGVSVQCSPDYYLAAHKAGMLSEAGQCHSFDERADGFVPGEGVGIVVLKRLRDALADGDHIHGLVRGSATNQDGTSNGITAPSAKSQELLEREVYDAYGIDPAGIQLVEAHGTGTRLGDPIEFQALTRAFRHYTDKREYCAIGSVKTNIGHAAPASGVAGLIKILLALRHRELPRSLHFERGNAHIDFAGSPFYVNTAHRPWTTEPGRPRRAALSSFGFSGTNAHAVVEEAPEPPRREAPPAPDHLTVLSAFSREQLRTQAERLAAHLRRRPETQLGDVSLTLLLGRRHCPVRMACVARDTAELVALLDRWLEDGSAEHVRTADLTESGAGRQASLQSLGDRCVQQCAEGATGSTRREHLEALRDLHLQGYEIDYARLFPAGVYRRVPLPVYPFQRQRYWLPEQDGSGLATPAGRAPVPSVESPAAHGHLALAPTWVLEEPHEPGREPLPADGVVVVGGGAEERAALAAECPNARFVGDCGALDVEELTERLRRTGGVRHLVWIAPDDAGADPDALLRRVDAGAVAFFRLVKALFALGYGGEELVWTVVTRQSQPVRQGEPVLPADAGVLGLAEVMTKELPHWTVKSFDLGAADDLPVRTVLGAPARTTRALRDGQWFRRGLSRVGLPEPSHSPYKEGGVYVVLGGAGGVGRLWTEDLIRRFGAQVVWIGRREVDAAIREETDRLAALGPAPWYVRADASDEDSLRAAHTRIRERFGTVDGVVQSVFGLVDQSLPNTTEQRFRQGLSAKVDASVRMAEVFDADDLDFMLFFSSIASVNPTMGYCSYVAGNAFEDALARRLAGERPYAVRVVNWGYWGAVGSGLEVPEHVRERIYRQERLGDIDPERAMDAVERLLASPVAQLVYLNTSEPERFEAYSDRETVRVLGTAARRSEPLAALLPARGEELRAVEAGAKSRLRTLDELLARLLWCELHGRGWLGDGVFDAGSLLRAHGITGKYDRWLAEVLKLFARRGWLVETDSGYRAAGAHPVDADATAAEWERHGHEWAEDPELRASVGLVNRTLPALADILTGGTRAVDVVFPGSSLDLVEGVYKRNAVADYFNEVVGDCVVAQVERVLAGDPQARLRILEVGAGTGGTTATVLRALRPYQRHIREYCYTDLSKAFLVHGRREFGEGNPFLRCELFDAGRPVGEQGFEEGAYDIVVATNVLHATKDVRVSLRNSKALLRPGGAAVVNEIDGYTVFGMLTFALLDGWWLYDDAGLRDVGGPALRPRMWRSVLEWEGFEGVEFPAWDAHPLGQQVVVGFSDGVIRQSRGGLPATAAEPVPSIEPVPPAEAASRPAAPVGRAHAGVEAATLRDAVRTYLKELVGRTLLIPVESIDPREPLSVYGIDSILILRLLKAVQKDLGETSSTLFFEHRTVEALTEYFVTARAEAVAGALGLAPAAPDEPSTEPTDTSTARPAQGLGAIRAAARPDPTGAVAIIGMSARFPQAETLDEFWENLRAGRSAVTEIPADRWALEGFYEPDKERAAAEGKSYSKWGGFLDGFADFDPLFFEMTPNEATEIDPQERLFLQESWRAFEDAGYTRARIEREHDSQVGVFVGISRAGHNLYGPDRWRRGDTAHPYSSFGSAANRVSFKLNLNGPSMPVDTMCSSSLTALHEACEHLLRGDCELALTGGVNLYLHPSSYISLCNLQMLADQGECRSFGAGGNGFVPGEGVGALVLKRLTDAERDGDHIHAVIRGTSINHGGATNGYTVPNPVAQGKVVRQAIDRAGIDARTISYVEAHGTGTALGDPIEVNGLTRAFSRDSPDARSCALGSVKSNIGHLEAAAGIAGVFKTLLQMRHGELVPSLHAEELNPHIDFDSTPFVVQREAEEWKRPVVTVDGAAHEVPRRAGVSSFGAGGANAHVVLEEYTGAEPAPGTDRDGEPAVIVLSAKDETRLRERASALARWLPEAERSRVALADVAHTLQTGREAMAERLGTVVHSYTELAERLRAFLEQPGGAEGVHRGRARRTDPALSALIADEDMSAIVATWLAQGRYAKALELWVNGFALDWSGLHPEGAARVVPLPTYTFARERYWIGDKPLDGRTPPADQEEAAMGGFPDSVIEDVLDDFLSGSLDTAAAAEHIRLSLEDGTGRHTDNGGR
ncbi:SDR family NAD(P)-dependent oxidoreductase [Nocardiopsis akebiae]|uniref:SDR family NAD(P)-dependent oxidoreductase n=1 Tax=Nocardiopsis akebiae TaxID=2831968 RepID=A0ABX8BXP8_9ACTN|nr:SDR family NAD(P)-dependent oxidoreductase [Nocardiopsis akebiae]QUX26970.1 SDR family NAD(P)-dependent oxidoreductase [Nocardiopsis akebiae]